ncbi:hypothetical protein [Stutzerimonas kunmingensis]|uniref:hypothetical protein n=1 Tax=Stutzerimonas kunmingensis TaxID=1211807 RepID=UPI0028975130|nr:hypothetical protein [Stutzerimonas kunmingensis]
MLSAALNELRSESERLSMAETISRFFTEIHQPASPMNAALKIFHELERLPDGDTFELAVEIDGNSYVATSFDTPSYQRIREHCENFSEEVECSSITLKIYKDPCSNRVSVYDLNSFAENFGSSSVIESLEAIATRFRQGISFVVFEMINGFGSETIWFDSFHNSSASRRTTDCTRGNKISLFNEHTISHQPLFDKFTPEDFDFTASNSLPAAIENFFSKSKLFFSIAYLSNHVDIKSDGAIRFKFNGYKSIVTHYRQIEDLDEELSLSYKIYSWAYGGGHCSDKLGLVRNVITLNAGANKINLTDSAWFAIRSNYEIYLTENITQYLSIKRDLLDSISNHCKKSLDIVDSFASSFQANTIAYITFVVGVVAVNGLKDKGVTEVFSFEYLVIAVLICATSLGWMIISLLDTHGRLVYFTEQITSSTQSAYKNIIDHEELLRSLSPAIESTRTHARGRINKFATLWVVTAAIFIVVFSVGYCFNKPNIMHERLTQEVGTAAPASEPATRLPQPLSPASQWEKEGRFIIPFPSSD